MAKRLLIVEDDGDVLVAMRSAVETAGYVPVCARSGHAALEALAGGALPDLLLVDYTLPDMNGAELLERKERWERAADVMPLPVLLVTGCELDIDPGAPGARSVAGVLGKPFETDDLIRAIGWALRVEPPTDPSLGVDPDLMRALVRSEKRVQAREDLLAMVCHDLRVPLTTVSMTVANLLNEPYRHKRVADCSQELTRVLRAARQMRRLTRDLLDFSQLEAGQLRVVRVPQPLGELVTHAVESARAAFAARRIELVADPVAAAARVNCDRARISQVIANLLGNACKHTPEGAGITVRLARSGNDITLAVEDEGAGIPSDELETVFEPYRRGRRSAEGGLGLGLYIARGVAAAHGGTLVAGTRPEGGAVFTLRLPCAGQPSRAEAPVILVVDDDEDIRVELAALLESEGYRVVTAQNGQVAWSYLRAHAPPALALLDLMMPVMDGWELLAEMKRDRELARTPAVVVSALEAQRVEPSLIDIAGYLQKPIHLPQLMGMVQAHAGRPRRTGTNVAGA
jgi:signal transduction histidine kinase